LFGFFEGRNTFGARRAGGACCEAEISGEAPGIVDAGFI
jgi:hypothetical protein